MAFQPQPRESTLLGHSSPEEYDEDHGRKDDQEGDSGEAEKAAD